MEDEEEIDVDAMEDAWQEEEEEAQLERKLHASRDPDGSYEHEGSMIRTGNTDSPPPLYKKDTDIEVAPSPEAEAEIKVNVDVDVDVDDVEVDVDDYPTVVGAAVAAGKTSATSPAKSRSGGKGLHNTGSVRPGAVSVPGEAAAAATLTDEQIESQRRSDHGLRKKQETHPAVQRSRIANQSEEVVDHSTTIDTTSPTSRHSNSAVMGREKQSDEKRRASAMSVANPTKNPPSLRSNISAGSSRASMNSSTSSFAGDGEGVSSTRSSLTHATSPSGKGLRGSYNAARGLGAHSMIPNGAVGGFDVDVDDMATIKKPAEHPSVIAEEQEVGSMLRDIRSTDQVPTEPMPTWSSGGPSGISGVQPTNNDAGGSILTPSLTSNDTNGIRYPAGSMAATTPSSANLAVASLVPLEEAISRRDLTAAEPYDAEEAQRRKIEEELQDQKRRRMLALIAVVIVVIGVIVAVVLVVTGGDSNDESTAVATTTSGGDKGNAATTTAAPTTIPILFDLPDYSILEIQTDPDSAQRMAYQWVIDDPTFDERQEWQLQQRFALATLWFATEGENWVFNEGWMNYDVPECEWFWSGRSNRDSKCVYDLFYESLILFSNNLRGTLPPELALLSNLDIIHLEFNDLLGTIPPQPFETLNALDRFLIGGNKDITGTIPTEIALRPDMGEINIADLSLTGTIPTEIQYMTGLANINIARNQLSGTLPTEMALCTSLVNISAHVNANLHGPIPSEFGLLTLLRETHLGWNKLTGTIPTELGNLKELWRLPLYHNDLSGTIPTELGSLTESCVGLWFDNNPRLGGTIPTELANLPWIRRLQIYNTNVSGSFPLVLEALGDTLQKMDITNTSITGVIPEELCIVGNGSRWINPDLGRWDDMTYSDGVSREFPLMRFDCSSSLCGCWHCNCSTQ